MNRTRTMILATAVALPLLAIDSAVDAAARSRTRPGDRSAGRQVERKRDRDRTCATAAAAAEEDQSPKAAAGARVRKRDGSCTTTPKAASAALRIRRQDRDRLCDECGYFVPGGEYVCDFCGTLCVERDDDGDGVPNCDDEDYERPLDGSGYRNGRLGS